MDDEALVELPPSTVTVEGGLVTNVEKWVLWNYKPWMTINVRRESDGTFYSYVIPNPEHRSREKTGMLEEVLESLHPQSRSKYVTAFGAVNPSVEELECLFPRHRVVFK